MDPNPSDEQVIAARQRIAAIYDELGRLPRDAFAQRATLVAERDALTIRLRAASFDEVTFREWADRASRKTVDNPRPHIPSHSEGGGALG